MIKAISLAMVLVLGPISLRPARAGESAASGPYTSPSRFTDPQEQAFMLDDLPGDVDGICEIARRQSVHHNLLAWFGVPPERWDSLPRVWPPVMAEQLAALRRTGPGDLFGKRDVDERLVGACMSEAHFLAGLLRHEGIPVRIRAGYFENVRDNEEVVLDFWENVARAKGVERELRESDPVKWSEVLRGVTQKQIDVDHHIEHWICEYWDEGHTTWRLLDADTDFLAASSGLNVGFRLPDDRFEYAWEAWMKMRRDDHFRPEQYQEWPQDGRSHIRSQLLWDFYSLLNHDIAGYGGISPATKAFVKERAFDEVTDEELAELDSLAALLSRDPPVEDLVGFYRSSRTLRVDGVDADPFSFAYRR